MKGVELAAALTTPVQGRGAQQGARPGPDAGNPDAGSFDAILNRVQGAPDKARGATDTTTGTAREARADDAAQPSDGGSPAAQDGATATAAATSNDAAALASSALPGSVQLAAGIQSTQLQGLQPIALTAATTPPAGPGQELSAAAAFAPAAAPAGASAVAATPGPDPRLAVPGALLSAQGAAPQPGPSMAAPVQPGYPGSAVPPAALAAAAPSAAGSSAAGGAPGAGTAAAAAALQQSAAVQTLTPGTGEIGGIGAPLGTPAPGLRAAVGPVVAATAPSSLTTSPVAPATLATPAPAAMAPAVAATGTAAAFAAVATAGGNTPDTARVDTTPAVAPTDAVAAAGAAAAAAPPASQPATAAPAPAPQPGAQTPSQAGATLQPQLAKPLFTLAGAPHGQHIMTLKVTPEDLGPMTVRAHIDAAGVRIELFAPGDAGREAIRGILPELRKELADAGFGASLDVSEHSGPGTMAQDTAGQDGTGRDGSGSGPESRNGPGEPRPGHRWDALADGAALRNARSLNGPQTTLDILV